MTIRKTILAGAAAFGLALGAAPAIAQQDLLIGSTSASSSHYGYFVAVAKLINENVEGASASVVETGASFDNLRRLQRDQIDMGLLSTNLAQHALTGTRGQQQTDLRMLWVYANVIQNVIVREDSGITSIAELEGRRFNPGIKGSGTESTAEAVFGTLGIAPDFVRGSTTDVVDMIKDDRITGYVKSGVGARLDASTIDIQTFTPIRILTLTEEQQATLDSEMKDISVVDIPASADGEVPARSTWSFAVGVVTTAELDEDLAYQTTKAVLEDESVQGAAMASVKDVDLGELTLEYSTIPLHPGALRAFREAGYDVPDSLVPSAQ